MLLRGIATRRQEDGDSSRGHGGRTFRQPPHLSTAQRIRSASDGLWNQGFSQPPDDAVSAELFVGFQADQIPFLIRRRSLKSGIHRRAR